MKIKRRKENKNNLTVGILLRNDIETLKEKF